MKRKLQNTTNKELPDGRAATWKGTAYKVFVPIGFILLFFLLWQIVCWTGAVPGTLLPTPVQTWNAFFDKFRLIMKHTGSTLLEAACGLGCGITIAFIMALLMDRFKLFRFGFKPLLVISQTIPTIAIAPIFVMWLGYGYAPKILLVALTTFFPIAIGLADGYASTDSDMIDLMRSMGANKFQIFWFLKFQNALPNFYSGLKISATYSVVGAVISEWVGAKSGLGFYILRMQKMYAYDVMFAIIFWIIILSLCLMAIVELLKRLTVKGKKEN